MNKKRIVKATVLAGLLWLFWLALPVYWFKAHNGDLPLPPFGWQSLPEASPQHQELLDPAFQAAAEQALASMESRRAVIGAPAFSAAVAVRGELVWRAAVGWADLASGTPVTPATVFRIGSTSKALTATALARMVDQGLIDLDAPVSRYLGELPNPQWQTITSRHLASHMSGLPHYKKNRDWAGLYQTIALRKHYADIRDAVTVFDDSPLLFEPGTRFYYSSLGTVLLGAVMSGAAGKPYRQIVTEQVLEPATMGSTVVAPRRAQSDANFATFYYRQDDRYREWRPVDLSHRLPGGGFASTPTDLVRMGIKQLDESYLSAATRHVFWMPQRLADGEVNEQQYALGWRWREWQVDGVGLARNANHGGVSRGSQCWLLIFPDFDLVMAFNINIKTNEFHEFGMFYQDLLQAFVPAIRAGD